MNLSNLPMLIIYVNKVEIWTKRELLLWGCVALGLSDYDGAEPSWGPSR